MSSHVLATGPASAADPVLANLIEEFADQLQTGAAVDAEAFIAQHPDHAEQLRRFLPAVQALADLGRSVASGSAAAGAGDASEDRFTGTLGDFRIVREVGRGGMGVVYEAEQISLGRRVALKVLPFAATMDPRHLQRFKNEAHAAACLQHAHIVAIHAVGCERGVHYFAMQYIEGQTLEALIRSLRNPAAPPLSAATADQLRDQAGASCEAAPVVGAADTIEEPRAQTTTQLSVRDRGYYRRVAEWGIEAAEALDHAHHLGIVHRDIKPGNLMIDAQGKLWVADFGLARISADSGLTVTGDVIGTLRYMSPEQALAKRGLVDHRTDIYSLGATLYELLTLEPVFAGNDHQELLRQIAFDQPRGARRRNRAIPHELDTIVGKAMERSPVDRYGTAQDLADDLGNYLDDRPLRARPPSWRQMAVKWTRRHPTLAWTSAVMFLFAAFTFVLLTAKRMWAEDEARSGLKGAIVLQQQEKWPEALGAIRHAQGALAGVWADRGLRQQIDELAKDLDMVCHLEQERREPNGTFDGSFGWYGLNVDKLNAQEAGDRIRARSIAVQLAAALDLWAHMRKVNRDERWRHLMAIARVADPDPWRNRLRDAMESNDGKALEELAASAQKAELSPATALLLAGLSRGTLAAERTLVVLRKVQKRHPSDFLLNWELSWFLCNKFSPPRVDEALPYATALVALQPNFARGRSNLGDIVRLKGLLDEAIAEFREAIRLDMNCYDARVGLGEALWHKKDVDGAIREFKEAVRIAKFGANVARTLLSMNNLAAALIESGQFGKAEPLLSELVAIRKKVNGANHPATAGALARCGMNLLQLRKFAEAEPVLRDCLTIGEKFQPAIWSTFSTKAMLGGSLLGQKKYAEAEPLLLQGYEGMKARGNIIPPQDRPRLTEALERLVQLYDALGAREKAAGWRKQLAAKRVDTLWQDLLTGQGTPYRFLETKYEGVLTAAKGKHVNPLEMKAGKTYVLDLESKAFDTLLILEEDGTGARLAENDDISPTNQNSRIIYSAPKTGTYRILATPFTPGSTGAYVLRIRELVEENKPLKSGP